MQHSARLATEEPFDRDGLFRFFADHAVPGLEDATLERYARPVRLAGGLAQVTAVPDPEGPGVLVTAVLASKSDVAELERRMRALFDLDAPSRVIDAALAADPLLAPLVGARPGIRMPGTLDAEETLFRTLLGQQISVAAARTVHGRLVAQLGDGAFPTAEVIARDGGGVLRGPAARIASIVGVARAIVEGRVRWDASPEELRSELLALPGIGPWTVGYLAMRAGHDRDVLLVEDLVIRQSAAGLGLTTPTELRARAERWAPWRSYACQHLWRARPVAARANPVAR